MLAALVVDVAHGRAGRHFRHLDRGDFQRRLHVGHLTGDLAVLADPDGVVGVVVRVDHDAAHDRRVMLDPDVFVVPVGSVDHDDGCIGAVPLAVRACVRIKAVYAALVRDPHLLLDHEKEAGLAAPSAVTAARRIDHDGGQEVARVEQVWRDHVPVGIAPERLRHETATRMHRLAIGIEVELGVPVVVTPRRRRCDPHIRVRLGEVTQDGRDLERIGRRLRLRGLRRDQGTAGKGHQGAPCKTCECGGLHPVPLFKSSIENVPSEGERTIRPMQSEGMDRRFRGARSAEAHDSSGAISECA